MLDHQLQRLFAPVINGLAYELLGVERHQHGRHCVVRVYIDHPNGITLEDCEKVSHQLSGVLDVEDPIKTAYTLEVSSPGLDRPLFTRAHFERFIGHEIKVRLIKPVNNRRVFTGTLHSMVDDDLLLIIDGKAYRLALAMIDKAHVVAKF